MAVALFCAVSPAAAQFVTPRGAAPASNVVQEIRVEGTQRIPPETVR